MIYFKETTTKNNRPLLLRSAEESDAEAYLAYYHAAHSETDFLTTYPDESRHDAEDMARRLAQAKDSADSVEICAFADGQLVGSAGVNMVRNRDKTRHRAQFGISVVRQFWGVGIGQALTQAAIDMARQMGYLQLELEVVAENEAAIHLYEKLGFAEFGRNPLAFRTRQGRWQEVVLMRLVL